MHNKYIITYECHDNAPRMWSGTSREIFWLLPVLSPLLPVVSHFSLWFQSSGSPAMYHWFFLLEITMEKKWTIWMFALPTAIYTHGPGLTSFITFPPHLPPIVLSLPPIHFLYSSFCIFSIFVYNKCKTWWISGNPYFNQWSKLFKCSV